jgi:hypothetical protein
MLAGVGLGLTATPYILGASLNSTPDGKIISEVVHVSMTKPLTSSSRPTKEATNTRLRTGRLNLYGDNPVLDGSIPYEWGAYPIITDSAPTSKVDTNSQANAAYESARTGYDGHLLYNAHIYYIGRDPALVPGSQKSRTTSAGVSKNRTNSS